MDFAAFQWQRLSQKNVRCSLKIVVHFETHTEHVNTTFKLNMYTGAFYSLFKNCIGRSPIMVVPSLLMINIIDFGNNSLTLVVSLDVSFRQKFLTNVVPLSKLN